MNISEFILKNVRCFKGEQQVRIAPLTFLVGENSTGKSTVLGCMNAVLNQQIETSARDKFNQLPYEFGTFTELAREPSKMFTLGFTSDLDLFTKPITVRINFFGNNNHTYSTQLKLIFEDKTIFVTFKGNTAIWGDFLKVTKEKNNFTVEVETLFAGVFDGLNINRLFLLLINKHLLDGSEQLEELNEFLVKNLQKKYQDKIKKGKKLDILHSNYPSIISLSPIRSKPSRTYDPVNTKQTPEGDDVPLFLMRIKREGDRQKIFESLNKFGKASKLFTSIDVKTYGKNLNEPFRLQVKVRNTQSNLLDVGYGISQLLPILVRLFADDRRSTMLLQQPEVHLHPRVQAELASLFTTAIAERKQSFIIETHSDYMIDRARSEIRRKNIKPDDVSLVYFEAKNGAVNIHNIRYDEQGNLLDVPQGYRDFFMAEGDRLLGFDN